MRRCVLILVVVSSVTACGGHKKPAAASGAVSWSEALRLLTDCKVQAVEQTHSRLVTLRLRSGGTAFAHEPKLDDLFRTLRRLPHDCAPRTAATE